MTRHGPKRFRHTALAAASAVLVVMSAHCRGDAVDDHEHLERVGTRDKVNEAVDKGLAFLAGEQDLVAGHFNGGDKTNTYTALSCMAFMAAGHFPGRSAYGHNLRNGIMYLARTSRANQGYFGKESNARMYGQGICTLALCEAYGMMQEEEDNRMIKEAIDDALNVIFNAQMKQQSSAHGGWRYEPVPTDADLSVTAWQVLALRAAQNCRLEVPEQTVRDAENYIRRTFNPVSGGFAYQPAQGPSIAMLSAGTVSLLALGAGEEEVDRGMIHASAEHLKTLDPGQGAYFYYQSYYVAAAANMIGGECRDTVLPKLEKVLLNLQMPTGEFRKHSGQEGGVYSTAFSVICLCVGYQYLPIYQE
jgi:prenyltransferase beta subunit